MLSNSETQKLNGVSIFSAKQGQPGIISCIAHSPTEPGLYAAGSYARASRCTIDMNFVMRKPVFMFSNKAFQLLKIARGRGLKCRI